MSESDLIEWARGILIAQTRELETTRRKRLKASRDAERLHKLRTRARRLRCALEDLRECTASARAFLRMVKRLGDKTGKARDGQVLLQRLRRYHLLAATDERSQIDQLLKKYNKRCKKWDRIALDAIRQFRAPGELL
ncbi:MAG: CHAD domain-containing protein [Candidatus Eremiobacteraeota bacterium]|nr:CHAD domain-containing protein [Candidatus Eremiobacteraeota bacterium]